MGNAGLSVGQVGGCVRVAEAQRALAQVVAHAEQIVDLAEASLCASFIADSLSLGPVDEPASPTVGRAVGEGAEARPAHSGLLCSGGEGEQRIQLVGVASREVLGRVAERRRLAFAPAMRPQSASEYILTADLDDHVDLGLSHRLGRSRGFGAAPAEEAVRRSAAARRRSRRDRAPWGRCRGCQARAERGGDSQCSRLPRHPPGGPACRATRRLGRPAELGSGHAACAMLRGDLPGGQARGGSPAA